MKIKLLTQIQQNCRGNALVEFSFVIPVLLLVLFGMFEVGRVLYTIHGLDVSARAGARAGVVQISNVDAINLATATTNGILGTFSLLDADTTCAVTFTCLTTVTAVVIPVVGRDAVQVTVNRTFNFAFTQGYLIDVGNVQLFPASMVLTSVATMRKEG